MATSQSVTLKADPDKVWGAVVKLVTGAGYPVAKTDQAAKQIVYQAKGGGWAWAQNVQVSVTEVDEGETMVTVLAESAGQASLTEGGQQRKLIKFVIDGLSEKFPLAENQRKAANAPGASGCYVVTATYGPASRQAKLVHARCRRTFLLNPLLTIGWCLYKYYGPILAGWSRSSSRGFRLCKLLVADPIIKATGNNRFISFLCMIYLAALTLLGLVLLIPTALVRAAISLVRPSHRKEEMQPAVHVPTEPRGPPA